MDEQVIDDLYARAQSKGYKKGRLDFIQLIQSDEDVFNDMYQYVQAKGYKKDSQDFSSLIGKTEAPAVKKKDTASVSEPGSLVSPEPEVAVEPAIAPAPPTPEIQDITGAPDPDFFEERMAMVSPELIDRGDEDEVAQELTKVFKPYGFDVEPTSIGDAIKVTAANGQTIEVDLDPWELPGFLAGSISDVFESGKRAKEKGLTFGEARRGEDGDSSFQAFMGGEYDTKKEKSEAAKLKKFLRENKDESQTIAREDTAYVEPEKMFVTREQREAEVKKINKSHKEVTRLTQEYLKNERDFADKYPQFQTYDPEYIKNNPEEYQMFLADRNILEGEREFLGQTHQNTKYQGAQLDRLAGEYTEMLAERGYWSGGVFRNEFIQGAADIAAGAKDFGLDTGYNPEFLMDTDPEFFRDNYLKEAAAKGYDVPSASDMTVDEFKAWMKTDKGIPAKESIAIQNVIVDTKLKRRKRGEPIDYKEAVNAYSQYATSKNMEVTGGELDALRRGLDFLKDSESTPEAADLMYESFWGGALLGVTRSLPAMLFPIGGWAGRTAAMYSQITGFLEKEMAGDPDFQNISEDERFRLKLAIGSVSSVLEAVGLRNVLKQQGLLTGILMRVLKKTPANVKGKAFNEVVMREVNSAIGRGALVVTSAGLAEFETGFLQEGVDISFKNIYNDMKDKEMFETPETWSWETLNRMLYAGAQEAVGGFVLGTPGAISAARGTYDFTAIDDATFEMFENVSNLTAEGELTYRDMFYTNQQARINRGEISKADAQQEMDNLDEVIAVNRDIPSDLTIDQQKRSLGILLRRKDLQEQIEGKDPILVKRQLEELDGLNGELEEILYGTPEDAIQEQGPESVDAPESTRDSEAVGEGVPDIGEPTTEVEAQDDVTDEATATTAEVAVDEGATQDISENQKKESVLPEKGNFGLSEKDLSLKNERAFGKKGSVGIYVDDESGETEIIIAVPDRTKEDSYLGYKRIKEKGKFTNKWSLKADLKNAPKGTTRAVFEAAVEQLPEGHILVETSNISSDGITLWSNQLKNNYVPTGKTFTIPVNVAGTKVNLGGRAIGNNEFTIGSFSESEANIAEVELNKLISSIPDASVTRKKRPVAPGDVAQFKFDITLPEIQRTSVVAPKKTVSEPTQGVTEEEQVDIDEFFGEQEIEGVERVSENLVINRRQMTSDTRSRAKEQRTINRVKQLAIKAAVSLSKQFPDVRIVLHETPNQYKRFAGELARGSYDYNNKTVHINLTNANLQTVAHEVFHALILEKALDDPNAVILSRKMLESVKKTIDPNSEFAQKIDKFVDSYADRPIVQDEEYLAELTGMLAAQYKTLNKPAQNAIKEFFRKLAKLIGIDKKFGLDEYFGPEFLKTDAEVVDLMNTISRKIRQGVFIESSDLAVMEKIKKKSTPEELKKARKDVEVALDEQERSKREKAERGTGNRRKETAVTEKAIDNAVASRQQIVGERASLEDDVRDGLDMAMLTYTEQGDSKKVRREVKAAWGWEKGADGKWRYEIETGELKKVPNGTYKLSDVYDAPELYKAYPEVKDISLTINVRDTGAEESWFIINKNAVEINVKNYGRVRPDLIHELQHYIQFKEGFAIGGNANTAIDLINSLSPDKLREINILEGKESAMSMLSDIAEESELTYVDDLKSIDTIEDFLNRNTKDANLLNSLYGDDAASYVLEVLNEDLIDLEDGDLMGGIYQVLQTIQEQTENKDGRSMWSPYAVYQRLIGEVEARNAAFRDGGGRSLIEDSEDTPREDQLAVFGEQEKVLRKIEAKEEMTEQELDALDLAKLPAQEGSNKGAGLFYGPRATIANYESAKTMFADGAPAEDIEMLTGWNVVEKQNGDIVYVLSRNEVESKDTIDKAIASRKDQGVAPRQQVEGINPKDVRMRSRSGNRVGKGLSVKKVNNEAVVEEIPDLTLDYVRENAPASYLKNANLIAQYPLVRGVKNFDDVSTLEQADEVYEVYARQVADNLNWIMESYPEEYREISTLWYDGANKIANELAADYGVSPEQVAGIIASLSPQNDWYQNVRAAELSLLAFRENPVMSQKMIDYQVNYAEGKINDLKKRIKSARKAKGKSQAKAKVEKFKAAEVKNLKAIADAEALLDLLRSYKGKRMEDAPDALKPYYVRLYNEVNQPKSYPIISPDGNYGSDALTDAGGKRKFGWGSYTEIGKGVSIRLDGSQENISVTLGQMHKIRNFFNNIIDPMSKEKDITMDTHAIAAALLIPASSKTKEVVQNFGTGTANSGVKGQKGLYYANQAGYFLSAEENNMLPRQVQSVTWEAVRGLFTSKFKDGAKNVKSINDIWENYAEGNITIEQARQEVLEKADGINAPSWAGLISDESRDGDGTTTERGRGKRGGPAAEREGVAPRQQVVYHVTVRDNKGNIEKKGLEKDRPPTFAKGVMGTAVFDTSGKSFAFSNLEDATKWGIKTKIEKDKEVSIVAINAEGKNLQEDKAVTEDPFNPLSSAVFTEDVVSPSDILSIEDVDYKFGKPFDKSGEPLTEESFDIKDDVAPRQQKPYPSGPQEATEMGYLVHASDKSRNLFDRQFIKGRNRTELGALGFYFTANAQKAMGYGGEYTYIDPADMNLLNLDEVKGNKLQSFLSDLERNLGKLSSYRMRLIAAQDEVRSNREFNELDAELKKVDAQIKAQSPFGTSASSQDRVLEALNKAKSETLMDAYKVAEYAIESRLGRKSDADAAFSDLLFNAGYDGIYEGPGLYKVAIFDIDGLNDAIVKDDVAPRQQLSDIATPLPRQQKSVREVVQQARDNNFKDAATKDFLKRKGVPTADIDKAIKTLDDVYARVMKEIAGVIAKSQKRGVPFNQQLDNALAYLQGTKLYEDTTDIHREKLIREVRAKFDKKEKRAPSAKRILGKIKDVKKVTMTEKEALKMQLRLIAKTAKTTARALVAAGNELTKSLNDMVKGGVITTKQMNSVLRRFSRVDLFNPASIDSFLDYMSKIFADAEYGAKIARIKKLLPRAKKNIKSKIGVADVLGDTLTKLFNVNPTLIPMEMLEDYIKLVEMMGASKNVLPLADINDVTEVANKVLNAVYEEISMAEDLAEVFANYENKVIKDGKLDYAATIEAMIADQTISLEEAAVMRKYKSRIVEPTKKEPKTEAELAEERAALMSAVEAAKVNVSRLVMEEERTLARQLAKLMGTEAIERLSNQQLETLLAVIDNINNGFVTHAAQRLAETMNASNRAELFASATQESKPLTVSKFIARVKAGITQNNKFFEAIKRRPLVYIDQLFGNHNTTRIYDSIFKPLAKASDSMNVEIQRIEERLDKAENAISKSFKRNPNKSRMSSYKRMTYMLQREFESNPDNGQVNPAADFIRATIDHIKKGKSFFKGRDAEMLQQILDDFGVSIKDADGNDVIQIDSQKLYDSFNKAERNALAVAEDINKSLASKAVFTAAVIRGKRVNALNQYAHHNVLSSSEQIDNSTSPSEIQKYNQSLRASTKSKNLIDRTGAVTPLNFDVLTSVSRGAKMMLTDFYLTDPIRTSRKTISNTRKVLEERGDVTEQEIEIVNAVDEALELTLDDLLIRTFTQSTWLENAVQYISRTGYRLILASLGRFGVELFTNSQFVAIFAPKQMKLGLSKANRALSMGNQLLDVMNNLGSTSTSRAYPDQLLSGRMIETSIVGEKSGDKGGRAYNDVRNKMTQIFRGLVNPGRKGIEKVADVLISTPDKAIIRPLWMGSFEYKFEEITKTKPDINKITDNDEAYMEANQEALDAATEYADQMLTFAGSADNPFKSILKGKSLSSVKQSAMLQAYNISNRFMTNFLIYEFISAQIGTYAMMGQGAISRRQGAALLGAVATRMVFYTLLLNVVSQITKSMFGLGDEEEEKNIEKQFGQALASTAVSLIVGRGFGNIVKGLLNYGVENLNEEFLDELRDGDYDPYRDSIAYTFVPADKEYKSNTLADYIRNLTGSFGPFYKMTEFGVKALSADEKKDPAARVRQLRELNERLPLEVLGNLGLIPFYREIRMILLADIYKDMGKEKKGGKTGMTKAEKAQMKEYFPEIYEMQMQMEEDMTSPELERFEKEMKLLEKQIEESLKQSR